ncbi:MAG: mitochondrial fission ELM1 family protein [Pseudomonadota bacterium]
MAKPLDLWVLSDGRAGHDAQSLGLAEALARQRPVTIRTVNTTLPIWARVLPPALAKAIGSIVPGWPEPACQSEGPAQGTQPDLIISTGRRAGLVAASLRRKTGARAVQILDPKLGTTAFDAMILPDHDTTHGDNVLRTVGAMTRLTPERVAKVASDWATRLPGPERSRLAVLVGGPSTSATFTGTDGEALIIALAALANHHTLIVTTSRRTPEALTKTLQTELPDTATVWTPEQDNPYPAMLGHADAVLVTEDSVNMASEAATVGLPVHVFPINSVAAKLTAFHRQLTARGASRRFEGKIETWSYPRLAEADRIAGEVIEHLSL